MVAAFKSFMVDLLKNYGFEWRAVPDDHHYTQVRKGCSRICNRSYIGRNPKTGEKVKIAPKKLPFFKPGKELKERVDG
jgi:hypothetical protein